MELQVLLHRLDFRKPEARQNPQGEWAENTLNYPQLEKVEQMARFIAENQTLSLSI